MAVTYTDRWVTDYLKLIKPRGTDPVDVQDFNDNFDRIDDAVESLNKSIPEHIPSQEEIDEMKGDINTNKSNITTLTGRVNNHETRISNLEQNPPVSSLDDLSDVAISQSLQDGDALVYDASQQKWVNGEGQAGIGLVIDNGLLCCQYEG